ncbi:hypothetical protein GN956_G1882 [Arapaima gigas]
MAPSQLAAKAPESAVKTAEEQRSRKEPFQSTHRWQVGDAEHDREELQTDHKEHTPRWTGGDGGRGREEHPNGW